MGLWERARGWLTGGRRRPGSTGGLAAALGAASVREVAYVAEDDEAYPIGDARQSSLVAPVRRWVMDNVVSGRIVMQHRTAAEEPWLTEQHSPAVDFLHRVNPVYAWSSLYQSVAADYLLGNAYLTVERDRSRRIKALWYLDPACVEIVDEGYVIHEASGGEALVKPKDVLHFRNGLDPQDPRYGYHRLTGMSGELRGDRQAVKMSVGLLENWGAPSMLFSPAKLDDISETDVDGIRRVLGTLKGRGHGRPLVSNIGMKVDRIGMSPQELGLGELQFQPEARVCAALGLSPIVLGYLVSQRVTTFSNYAQARRASYEDFLGPLVDGFLQQLSTLLLPEFGLSHTEWRYFWDRTGVAALQDDASVIYGQNSSAVRSGYMTINEARVRIGLDPLPDGDRLAPQARDPGEARQLEGEIL